MKRIHKTSKERRKLRVRKNILGSDESPRISIFRSNRYLYAQAIDDKIGKTIHSVRTGVRSATSKKITKVEASEKLGELFGAELIKMKISKCVYDRGPYKYHGRVKSFAEGMRSSGVKF